MIIDIGVPANIRVGGGGGGRLWKIMMVQFEPVVRETLRSVKKEFDRLIEKLG